MNMKLVLVTLLSCTSAGGLRRSLKDDGKRCDLAVEDVGGSATIKVDPDVLIITAQVRGLSAAAVGAKASELKAKVAAVREAATYEQNFRQETVWNSETHRSDPGDWVASVTVTLPYKAGGENSDDGGLHQATELISQIVSLSPSSTSSPEPLPHVAHRLVISTGAEETETPPASASSSLRSRVSISVTHTRFDISDTLREAKEKQALSLAVEDAIARIGETTKPFLTPGDGYSDQHKFGPSSLTNVKISTGFSVGASYSQDHGKLGAAEFALASVAGDSDAGVPPSFVNPGKRDVTQSVSVTACVEL